MGQAGRPKGTDNKETVISMRMNRDMAERLEVYCKKMNLAKSEVLRRALEDLINKTGKEDSHESGTSV